MMNGLKSFPDSGLYRPLTDHTALSNPIASTPGGLWAARFVSLLPGRFGDPIRCQLLLSTIGEMEGRYEALSYTWGNVADKIEACVNNRPFLITRNLETALRHLRLGHSNRLLWIDSVCINQTSVTEVNTQVRRMGAIYENAHRVVVFLGPRADGSDEALRLISDLAAERVGLEYHRVTALLEDQQQRKSWEGLLQFMQRPWWSRAWIVQEYAVARTVTFVCGFIEMPGDSFGNALNVLVDYRFNGQVPRHHQRLIRHIASTPIHHLWSTRQNYQTLGPDTRLGAANILYRFRGSKSYDPRDKVYSLYWLIAENEILAPDYNKSVAELFQNVVKVMIETSGTLEVLSHHNRPTQGETQGITGLPNWCPDWTIKRGKRILLWPNEYQAAGNHSEPALFHIEEGTLTLRGKVLDRIKWLKAFESDDFDNIGDIYRDILEIEVAARQLAKPGTDIGTLEDALRRTLVAARLHKKGPNQDGTVLGEGEANPPWFAWSSQAQGRPYNEDFARWYNDALYSAMSGRAFIITEKGTLGLADGAARVGDVVGVFSGGQVPLALRCSASTSNLDVVTPSRYELVGEW